MKEEGKQVVSIQALKKARMSLDIVSEMPLLMDRMPEEVQEGIIRKQQGIKSEKKKIRDIKKETYEAVHRTSKGKVGFPAAGFKGAIVEAAARVGDKMFSKKLIRGAIRIINQEDGLIPISYSKEEILKHNIGHNIKFTPMFKDWGCRLVIEYDANNISANDIGTLLNYAGFYVGVGAWRPTCKDGGSGEYGTFKVKTQAKV